MGNSKNNAENPYLAARREWLERYGSYMARERVWRITALGAIVVAAILAIGLWSVKADQRVLTYVVEVDGHGGVIGTRQVAASAKPEEKHIRAQLIEWLTGARTVYVDQRAIERGISKTYASTMPASPARTALGEFHAQQSPYQRAAAETVELEVRSAMPLTADTWRIEWDETVRQRSGKLVSQQTWQATVNIVIAEPTSPQQLVANPFGVFVKQFSWAQRL